MTSSALDATQGVIANVAVFFGLRVLFPETGGFSMLAALLGVATFGMLRRLAVPTYHLVPIGALLGRIWVLGGMR